MSTAVFLFSSAASVQGAGDPLARFNLVAINPAVASIYIATVSMSFQPFVLHRTVFSSTYSARVFPYFFWSEKGRIWIVVADDALRRADRGESISFTGHALSDSGSERRFEGRATPTGASTGKIKVRVFVTRRIVLTYDMIYELKGAASPQPAVTPRGAR